LEHKKQVKNSNTNTEGLDALHQVERGRENQTSLADDDLGPISRSSQGSAIQEGDDVAIGVGRGEPNQGAVNVFRCTTPLSSKPNQEAVQASLAYVVARAVKTPSTSTTNKK
jgi:hypothetical protein